MRAVTDDRKAKSYVPTSSVQITMDSTSQKRLKQVHVIVVGCRLFRARQRMSLDTSCEEFSSIS